VVQVFTGFEDLVKTDLEKRIQEDNLQDLFGQVLIPTGEIMSFFAENKNKKEKIFPGYLLVNMEMTGDSFRLVSSNPRITRFLGGESPVPLTNKEVDRIFAQMEGKLVTSDEKALFTVGNEVHISNGPFSGFVGIIDKVAEDRERVTVMISIFGRLTPVELGFDQVKK
jgi:transcriptional antiterminator NusG